MERMKQKSTQIGLAMIAYGVLSVFVDKASLNEAASTVVSGIGLITVNA